MTIELFLQLGYSTMLAAACFHLGVLFERGKPRRLRRREAKQMLGRLGK